MPKHFMLVAAMAACGVAQATTHPVLITFDGNVQSDYRLGVLDSGVRFTDPYSTTMVIYPHVNTQGASNGTPTLLSYQYPMTMQRRDGQPFTLQALDIGWYWLPENVFSETVQARLTLPSGETVSRSLVLDWGGFDRWTFGDAVSSVTFEQPFYTSLRYDNVDTLMPSAVPEPPASLMLALGAGILGWRLRRRGLAPLSFSPGG